MPATCPMQQPPRVIDGQSRPDPCSSRAGWREQAQEANFSMPITMSDLLAASMIAIDERHLTVRFLPRIEAALAQLETMGVIGKYVCLTPIDTTQARWGASFPPGIDRACWQTPRSCP